MTDSLPPLPREIDAPARGERYVFLRTATDTNGAFLEFDHYMDAGCGFTNPHLHDTQEERYEILSGTATYSISEVEKTAQAGQTIVIPPGTEHINPWNKSGDGVLHIRRVNTPEGDAQLYFVTLLVLSRAGWRLQRGTQELNLVQLAVVADAIAAKTYITRVPVWPQRLLMPVVAAFGRLIGYRARYPELEKRYFGGAG